MGWNSYDCWGTSVTEEQVTNYEVPAIDQDSLCAGTRRVSADKGLEVWAKELADGSHAVGLFNRSGAEVAGEHFVEGRGADR